MERLIPQKAALCTSGLLSHRSNISKPMERQKAMGVSALSKQDRQLTRKEIYSMLMYWLFKKGMQKTQIIGLPLVITCTAGFACFMVSVPPGPGQPKCLFSIIISLFTLEVNSFTDSWWQSSLAKRAETETSVLPVHLTEGKTVYKSPWLRCEWEKVQVQAQIIIIWENGTGTDNSWSRNINDASMLTWILT